MQNVLSQLNRDDLYKFKIWYNKWQTIQLRDHILEGDVLDFVDKVIELYGKKTASMMWSLVELNAGNEADILFISLLL